MVQEVENFYGVYLLYNINPKYKGRIYIGYTVDPNRRIKQHNTGAHAGGAFRTSGKGPWDMVLIIHGFPNEIQGLRFEWAWQHPEISRRLRHVQKKSKSESQFDFRFRVVSEMLRAAPWNRLALTVRWLKQEYRKDFAPHLSPPLHMAMAYGPVKSRKVKPGNTKRMGKNSNEASAEDDDIIIPLVSKRCAVCSKLILPKTDITVACVHPRCPMMAHILCLSQHFLGPRDPAQIIPVEGACPRCQLTLLWADVIRHKQGCYQNLIEDSTAEESEDDHWANELQTQVT